MTPSGRRWCLLALAVAAIVAGSSAMTMPTAHADAMPPVPAATPPCPFITASSPQTLSTNPPPVPLNPCPGVVMGTYLGGIDWDWATDVAVDMVGNSYVVGWTRSSDFFTTFDAFDASLDGPSDAFVAKFDPTGALTYSTLLGGAGEERGRSIAVDASGNMYVAGGTLSPDFPTTPNAFDTALGEDGQQDAFIVKFDATGSVVYSTLLGGAGGAMAWSVAVDASGDAYLTGPSGGGFPVTPGVFSSPGGTLTLDVFVAKVNQEGSDLLYSTVIGGFFDDWPQALAVDESGDVYVTGYTFSDDFPITPNAPDGTKEGSLEAFVLKLSADASALEFSTFLGGGDNDQAFAIALDLEGNVLVAGSSASTDYPTTADAYDRVGGGGFLTRIAPTGELLYSTFVGDPTAGAWGIYVDQFGSVHVTGGTRSDEFPTTPGAYDATYNGVQDSFVMRFEGFGPSLNYSTFLGGGDEVLLSHEALAICPDEGGSLCGDIGYSVAVDGTGNATVIGTSTSQDFPTTENGRDPTFNGDLDAFVVRIELIPEPNRPPLAYFEAALLGENSARVIVNASHSADPEDADDLLQVRWDWEDDGIWDTGWSIAKTASHDYAFAGTYSIRLEVRDMGGLVGSAIREVVVSGRPFPPPAPLSVPLWVPYVVVVVLAIGASGALLWRYRRRLRMPPTPPSR